MIVANVANVIMVIPNAKTVANASVFVNVIGSKTKLN